MSQINWPREIEQSPTAHALENALAHQRLGHAVLLTGNDQNLLDASAVALTEAILGEMPHPDYKHVQPTNKLRQIGVEGMRAMRQFLQTSSASGRKVAHIAQADRLNTDSANLFLKSLEEPPQGAFIIMTSTQAHAILPTLLSRLMRFRLNADTLADPQMGLIVKKVSEALNSPSSKTPIRILQEYALLQDLYEAWSNPPKTETFSVADMNASEVDGIDEAAEALGLRSHRNKIFAALQEGIWEAFRSRPTTAAALVSALNAIERANRFMKFSLNDAAVLEAAVVGSFKAYRSFPS